jgi:hypothetical protein
MRIVANSPLALSDSVEVPRFFGLRSHLYRAGPEAPADGRCPMPGVSAEAAYRESMMEKRTRIPPKESAHSIWRFIPVIRPLRTYNLTQAAHGRGRWFHASALIRSQSFHSLT